MRKQLSELFDDIDFKNQQRSLGEKTAKGTKDLFAKGVELGSHAKKDAVLYLTTALSTPEVAEHFSSWAGKEFNNLSNAVTKAMDGDFALGLVSGPAYVSPEIHRLFGGHTIPEAFSAAAHALPDASHAEIALQAFKALASDMSSASGLPLFTFTKEGYESAVSFAGQLGISQEFFNDVVTFNAVEVLGAAVPAIAILLGWSKGDRKRFWESLGAFGVSAVVSANPILAIVIVIAAALDFHRNGRSKDEGAKEVRNALIRGGIMSGIVLGTSATIGGPIWVGLLLGIILSILAKKYGQEVDFEQVAKHAVDKIRKSLTTVKNYG